MAYKIKRTPVDTGNPKGTKANPVVRKTYHANETYVVKGADGKPKKVSYEAYNLAKVGDRQRMSAADAEKLFRKKQ